MCGNPIVGIAVDKWFESGEERCANNDIQALLNEVVIPKISVYI